MRRKGAKNRSTLWCPALDAAEQFQDTGRGSCAGHATSQWSAYHGAGVNGSWHALGAMYAKNGRSARSRFFFNISEHADGERRGIVSI